MKDENYSEHTGQLLKFYEEFINFQGDCSFLCEAITSMATEEEFLGTETALGINRHAHSVKSKGLRLQQELKEIYQKTYTHQHSVHRRGESVKS